MVLGRDELTLREEIRRTEADRARLLAGTDTGPAWTYRTIPPADEPPIARRDIDELKEAVNMMARSLSSLVALYEQMAERLTGQEIVYPKGEGPDSEDILP